MADTEDVFNEILNHGPSADSLLIVLTRMKKEGRLNRVVQECIKFLRVYPDDIRLRFLLAESYLGIGFIGLAEAELKKVISMIEKLIPAHKMLATIYIKQKRLAEAADMAKHYLAYHPSEPEALKLLEEIELPILSDEVPLKVERPTDDVVREVDEPIDAVVDFATPTIAELYHAQGQLSAAISTYENVLRNNPDDGESLRRLNELRRMAAKEPVLDYKEKDDLRARKEKMITILERWLPKVREIRHA